MAAARASSNHRSLCKGDSHAFHSSLYARRADSDHYSDRPVLALSAAASFIRSEQPRRSAMETHIDDRTTTRRALGAPRRRRFVAWVCIGTGGVLFALALPFTALGAFVVGALCAYASRGAAR
jgi:hypothetical protein